MFVCILLKPRNIQCQLRPFYFPGRLNVGAAAGITIAVIVPISCILGFLSCVLVYIYAKRKARRGNTSTTCITCVYVGYIVLIGCIQLKLLVAFVTLWVWDRKIPLAHPGRPHLNPVCMCPCGACRLSVLNTETQIVGRGEAIMKSRYLANYHNHEKLDHIPSSRIQ